MTSLKLKTAAFMTVVVLVAAVTGTRSAAFRSWKLGRERDARIAAQGKPVNGGKPTAPIQVEASIEGEIPAEEWVDVTLRVIPQSDCTGLTSVARGVDGLEVSDDATWSHPNCVSGEAVTREIRVRIPAEASGLLAVDLHMEMPGGAEYDVTRSVGYRAEGAPVLLESK